VSLIVVDDASSDGTPDVVRRDAPRARLIERRGTPCLTDSLNEGIRAAETEYVAWMDADFSHPPELIPELAASARQTGCAIATRYAGQTGDRDAHRDVPRGETLAAGLSAILNWMVRGVLQLEVTDYTSGFIVCRRELLADPLLGDYGEYFIELMVRLARARVAVREIPYVSPPRTWGESKTGSSYSLLIRRGVKYLWLVTKLTARRVPLPAKQSRPAIS
jgi:dolichol-phosphate mannosyltransferase